MPPPNPPAPSPTLLPQPAASPGLFLKHYDGGSNETKTKKKQSQKRNKDKNETKTKKKQRQKRNKAKNETKTKTKQRQKDKNETRTKKLYNLIKIKVQREITWLFGESLSLFDSL